MELCRYQGWGDHRLKVRARWQVCNTYSTNQILNAGLIEALVDAACDKEGSVSDAIFKSIVDIGRKKYVIVLQRCLAYLTKHNKVSRVRPPFNLIYQPLPS